MLTERHMIRALNRAAVYAQDAGRTLTRLQREVEYSEDVAHEDQLDRIEDAQWRLQDALDELQEITGVRTSP